MSNKSNTRNFVATCKLLVKNTPIAISCYTLHDDGLSWCAHYSDYGRHQKLNMLRANHTVTALPAVTMCVLQHLG